MKNRLVDVRVYYVSFFDLKDAILAMIFTVHNVITFRTVIKLLTHNLQVKRSICPSIF
ncbi:hypothetical protein XNC1_2634 [Xenorhabdus nematophila ATCC 19061]|uniref:Uncharacterized protein n=1 Tax=Xenorhabdus nematophila (strain ATCC 19061 / DSM 3370 / CCUG 14189 / LMG 1036 / NCIMB 9965 / AN6) TaxID=406817 RepID=D3VI48_XENNA|nr:hypothetical protein XNC1_2634 [Xenorhabdus nematophila ATCC 19061]